MKTLLLTILMGCWALANEPLKVRIQIDPSYHADQIADLIPNASGGWNVQGVLTYEKKGQGLQTRFVRVVLDEAAAAIVNHLVSRPEEYWEINAYVGPNEVGTVAVQAKNLATYPPPLALVFNSRDEFAVGKITVEANPQPNRLPYVAPEIEVYNAWNPKRERKLFSFAPDQDHAIFLRGFGFMPLLVYEEHPNSVTAISPMQARSALQRPGTPIDLFEVPKSRLLKRHWGLNPDVVPASELENEFGPMRALPLSECETLARLISKRE